MKNFPLYLNGEAIKTPSRLNFIEGSNVTISITDDGITIESTGGGSASWGGIGGDIGDQTDLSTALESKLTQQQIEGLI